MAGSKMLYQLTVIQNLRYAIPIFLNIGTDFLERARRIVLAQENLSKDNTSDVPYVHSMEDRMVRKIVIQCFLHRLPLVRLGLSSVRPICREVRIPAGVPNKVCG